MSIEGRTNYPFVESTENRLGIGKLISRNGNTATVEYFRSPVDEQPIQKSVSFGSLTTKTLLPETRAYYRNPSTFATEVGRVLAYHSDDQAYFIRFPNDQSRMILSDELQVRCHLPISEPTDHLASQVNETAFWHAARSEFVRHLLDQHKISRGLSALVSSSVELVAHQASVVHQVLLDPFQRYLLADEVGLGKTIEAGVLIKQFTLDEPNDHETLIIVPDSLLIQWQQELTHRFHLGERLGHTVHIVGSRDRNVIAPLAARAKMIVIDEAHHLSSWAWSAVPAEQAIFNAVKQSCEDMSRRVLLLSATPVLHNEQSFLAMLHLLDPQVYPLDSLDVFKERVRLRQEIAECLLSVSETESNFFLEETLNELAELLPGDTEFQSLRVKLAALIEDDVDEQDERRVSLIRSIRTHISDMWRLHRRILRNRHTEQTSAYTPGRGGAECVVYECHNEQGLADAVEAWRLSLSAACFSADESVKSAANDLARMMDEHAACEPHLVLEFAKQRLENDETTDGQYVPLANDETGLLKQVIRAAKECDQEAKLQKLLQLVGTPETGDSYVVFTNDAETADQVFEFLDLRLPGGRTLRHSSSQLEWMQFKSDHRSYVLVCDRAAEEGLNLQKRGACAIHFDLPFSPNRIEQRMGRLDRFGVGRPVQSAVLVCGGSNVQKAWFHLLEDALGVFRRSIASLQYVIEDSMNLVWNEFRDSGSDAFAEASERLGGEEGTVAKELKRIRAQDDIDSFDTDQITQKVADELEGNDRKLSREAPAIFGKWAVTNLHFRVRGEKNKGDSVFTYDFTRRVDTVSKPYGQDTLMPADEFKTCFDTSIDSLPVKKPTVYTSVPFTYDRVTSQQRSARLLRVGDPFVDAFEQFTRWDDRGICYAFWRQIPEYNPVDDPDVFFRFDYVVTPNPKPLVDLCDQTVGANSNSLLRRSRAIMEPQFTTLWLDSNLERVLQVDERFELITPAFRNPVTASSRDFNLNRDRWTAAATLYDMSLWRDLCFAARRQSETILREQSRLPELSDKCVAEAKELAGRVEQQFRSRLAMATGEVRASLERDLAFERAFFEAQVDCFRNPELRADSVGAVFLSRQMPFVERPNDGEDDD